MGVGGLPVESGGWAAPLDDDATLRPSQHPQRRRMHQTAIVYGPDGTDVSVLECVGEPLQVLRGAVGVVPELMRRVLGSPPKVGVIERCTMWCQRTNICLDAV